MGKRERIEKVSEIRILKHLAKYDPELAEELATSGEPVEERIAQELMFARMIKYQKIRELDLETLMVTFDFWNEMMKRAIQYISSTNAMFMMNFLEQYTYIAQAVQEKLRSETPDARTLLAMKGLELMDELKDNIKKMNQPYLSFYNQINGNAEVVVESEKEVKNAEKKKSRRRKKVAAKR